MQKSLALAAIAFSLPLVVGQPVWAGPIAYEEVVSGDLSNDGLFPTAVAFAMGANRVFGTTGTSGGGVLDRVAQAAPAVIDRDFFTFDVPVGLELSSVTVLPGTTVGGSVSFIGLQAGGQVTDLGSATSLLGWWHYGLADVNRDILPDMGAGAGAIGFAAPLPAGSYAVWIQEVEAGVFDYGFDFRLTRPGTVPEPASAALMVSGLGAVWLYRRRRSARTS